MFGEALAGRKMFSLVNERLDLRVPRLRLRDHFRKEIIGTQLGILLRDPGVLFYGGLVTLHQLEVGGASVEHVAIEALLHVAELVKNRGLSTKQRISLGQLAHGNAQLAGAIAGRAYSDGAKKAQQHQG